MPGSAADLQVGEIRGRACRLSHFDRRMPFGVSSVSELAMLVESPGVDVAVAA